MSAVNALRPYAAGAVLFAVAMGIGRFAYTPLLVVMRTDAGLTVTLAGVLASANLAGYLAGALAAMLPALKTRRVTMIRFAALGVALLTAAMAGPAGLWITARFLTGACSGVVFVLTVSVMLDLAIKQTSRWGPAVFFSGVGLGIAAAGLLVPAIAGAAGSRGTWLALGAASVLAVLVVSGWLPRASGPIPSGRAAAPAANDARFWWLALVYGVEGAVYIIPATFLVAMVAQTPAIARFSALTWVIVGLVAAPSVAVWSVIARRLGNAPAFLAALAVQAAGLLVPAFVAGAGGVLAVAVGLGGTFMGISALGTSLGRAYWPAKSNAAVGVLTVLYGVGQIAGPLFATRVAVVTGSYRAAFPIAAVTLFAATALFAVRLILAARRDGDRAQRSPIA